MSRVPAMVEWVSDYDEVDISTFESTDPNLTGGFLKECVRECTDLRLNRTHFIINKETSDLMGFIALSTRHMTAYKTGPRGIRDAPKSPPDYWPAVKIDQIAVTKKHLLRGFGRAMVTTWISYVEQIVSPVIGCRYILVEGYEGEGNIEFFEKLGFRVIPEDWMKESRRKRPAEGKILVLMCFDLLSKTGVETD